MRMRRTERQRPAVGKATTQRRALALNLSNSGELGMPPLRALFPPPSPRPPLTVFALASEVRAAQA